MTAKLNISAKLTLPPPFANNIRLTLNAARYLCGSRVVMIAWAKIEARKYKRRVTPLDTGASIKGVLQNGVWTLLAPLPLPAVKRLHS
jgi:hypothetical protein